MISRGTQKKRGALELAPNVIKAVVGEDWILERTPSHGLKFVLYMNTFHHLPPDSAPLEI